MKDSASMRCPYPGLRAFRRDEADLFFGREQSISYILNLLHAQKFVAVLGSSGSGKSSLIRTGVLDALELGLMTSAGPNWLIVDHRPGADPFGSLSSALVRSVGGAFSSEDVVAAATYLKRGPRSLIEWWEGRPGRSQQNLLLFVDQFEELFRSDTYERRQETEAFVSLLLESSGREVEARIYVILTMRSEYLGACSLFPGLVERMNAGQFLTPRLSREQAKMAIEGPAAVCGIEVEALLVQRLLNDLSTLAPWEDSSDPVGASQLDSLARRADQLPLLQHVLNRMWHDAVTSLSTSKRRKIVRLTLAGYERMGGLSNALNIHADQVLATLPPRTREAAEAAFRALTTGSGVADAGRHRLRYSDLVRICLRPGISEADVAEAINTFRQINHSFLLPTEEIALDVNPWIDVSHESVIRQWRQLATWLDAEAQDAREWRRLSEAADLHRKGQGELLTGINLDRAISWKASRSPTVAWVSRYDRPESYDATLSFLDQSIASVASKKRVLKAAVAITIVVLATTVFLVGYSITTITEYVRTTEQARHKKQLDTRILKVEDRVQRRIADWPAVPWKAQLDAVKRTFAEAEDEFRDAGLAEEREQLNDRVLGLVATFYQERFLLNPKGAKPFQVFEAIGTLFPPRIPVIIETHLSGIATNLISEGLFAGTTAALGAAADVAATQDKRLQKYSGSLLGLVGDIRNKVDNGDNSYSERIALLENCIALVNRILAAGEDNEARELLGDLYGSQGYIAVAQFGEAGRKYINAAIDTYSKVRSQVEYPESIDDKIRDLRDLLPRSKQSRRPPGKKKSKSKSK